MAKDLTKTALRIFSRLTEDWRLDDEQQAKLLGFESADAFNAFSQSGEPAPEELILRISHILDIYRAARTFLPNDELVRRWIFSPNRTQLFGGQRPIDRLLRGRMEDIIVVRDYLEALTWS